MANVIGRRGGFVRVLDRWCAARVRLGLGPSAQQAGALLLSVQVDESACRALVRPQRRNPTHGDLVAALGGVLEEEEAAQALLHLEERGAARAQDDGAGPWFDAEESRSTRGFAPTAWRWGSRSSRRGRNRCCPRRNKSRWRGFASCSAAPVAASWWSPFAVLPVPAAIRCCSALLAMAGVPALRKTCYDLRGGADRLEPELGGFAADLGRAPG